MESIGVCAFQYCGNLTEVTIPGSVTLIDTAAFAGSGVQYVIMREGVSSIGESAFQGCGSLKSVEIPASVNNIGNNVFSACANLETITFKGSKEDWNALVSGKLIGLTSNVTITCSDGKLP